MSRETPRSTSSCDLLNYGVSLKLRLEVKGMSNKKSKNKDKRGKAIVVNGKEYPSISDAARSCGLPVETVIDSLKRG